MNQANMIALMLSIMIIRRIHGSCVPLFNVCNGDCDCCGNDVNKNVRCELRNQSLGKRCYETIQKNQPCTIDSQCVTQKCVNNICRPIRRTRPLSPVSYCPLVTDPSNVISPVDGVLPTCACPKGPTQDASSGACHTFLKYLFLFFI